MRRRSAGRAAWVALVVALSLLPFLVAVHALLAGPRLHEVRLGLVGPALVAQALEGSATSLPGRPFAPIVVATDAGPGEAVAEAEVAVASGSLDAAVVLDLAGSEDRLLVAATASDAFVEAVAAQADVVAAGYGRQLVVRRVDPEVGSAGSGTVARWLVAAWCALGVLAAGVVTALRGPVAATERRGLQRLGVLALAGLVAGGGSGAVVAATSVAGHGLGTWAAVGAVGASLTVAVAWLVTAAEGLFGLWGLAPASALALGPAVTMLAVAEPRTLPVPWDRLHPFGPQDAAHTLLAQQLLGADAGLVRAVVVLAGWALVALVALGVARRVRPADAFVRSP